MAGSEKVLEGFICPICMTEFKAPNQLTKHFEDFHNDDPEILKSLKGTNSVLHNRPWEYQTYEIEKF